MKGIVLAGGSATRLAPASFGVSKQLMPIYDKPMIYYPVSLLLRAGIRDILIISTPHDLPAFRRLFSFFDDGKALGIRIEYAEQPSPNGLAQAFVIGAEFAGTDPVALVLGDNMFHGHGLDEALRSAADTTSGATIFGCYVQDPERYGVVEFDADRRVISLEEKPSSPKSNYAVPGLYFYDNTIVEKAQHLKPSIRGEYEITDINNLYLKTQSLRVNLFDREMDWFDTGTHESMLQSAGYVQAIQKRKGYVIACLEEIVYRNGWIDRAQLQKLGTIQSKTDYGQHILKIANGV